MTKVTSREFNQSSGQAKRAAKTGPVFITDRGEPAFVLLSIEEYHRITHRGRSIAEILAMPEGEDVEFEPASLNGLNWQIPEFE